MNPENCCICDAPLARNEFNNPWPWPADENAKCCDLCNNSVVVPARLRRHQARRERDPLSLFRNITPKEERKYRKWARDNYDTYSPINATWHPVVQDECRRMNAETGKEMR